MTEPIASERLAVVAQLHELFRDAASEGQPSLVCLEGDPGVGKTRVVRELYARLAAGQGYWPAALPDPPDLTPLPAAGNPDGAPPWVWWSVVCGSAGGAPAAVLRGAAARLEEVLAPAVARLERRDAIAQILKALATFGTGFVPLGGAPASVGDLVGGAQTAAGILGGRDRRGRSSRDEDYAIDQAGRDRSADVERIARLLAELGAAHVPFVLVLDNAHDAEPEALALLDRIFASRLDVGLLCVCTATIDINPQDGRRAFQHWIAAAERRDPYAVRSVRLEPLSDGAIRSIVHSRAPRTDPGTIEALAVRADGNPAVLAGMLDAPRCTVVDGAIDLDAKQISRLPVTRRERLDGRWAELPPRVQGLLSLAALQGRRFSGDLAVEAVPIAGRSGAVDTTDPEGALDEAVKAATWVRLAPGGVEFADHYRFETALRHLRDASQVDPADVAALCAALCARIDEAKRDASGWAARTRDERAVLLDAHVALSGQAERSALGEISIASAIESSIAAARDQRRRGGARAALPAGRHALVLAARLDDADPLRVQAQEQLAITLDLLAQAEEALELRREALAARRLALGSQHPLYIEARGSVADLLEELHRFDEALPHREAVLALRIERHGESDERTLAARAAVAGTLGSLLRHQEALPHRTSVRDSWRRERGQADPRTLAAHDDRGRCLRALGRQEEAIAEHQEALHWRERDGRAEEFDALDGQESLAIALLDLGQAEAAVSHLEHVVAGRTRLLGGSSLDSLLARFWLGRALMNLNRWEEGSRELEAVARGYRRLLVEMEAPTVRQALEELGMQRGLAVTLDELGLHKEALPHFEAVLAGRCAALGEGHLDTLEAQLSLAVTLGRLGKYGEALPHCRAVLAGRREALGEGHLATLHAQFELAHTLYVLGSRGGSLPQLEAALPHFKAVFTGRREALGDGHLDTLTAQLELANTLFALGSLPHLEAALPHLKAVFTGRKEALGEGDPRTLQARRELANTLLAMRQGKLALLHFEAVLAGRREALGEGHQDTIHSSFQLAETLCFLGAPKDALPHYEAVLALDEGHPDAPEARSGLVMIYEAFKAVYGEDHEDTIAALKALRRTATHQRAVDVGGGANAAGDG